MDIKTRLEDDKVLFQSFLDNTSRSNILKNFNEKGIFTVEDFINTDSKMFNSQARNIYNAMIHVFRNAYLSEPLVYDVLLQQQYSHNDEGRILLAKDIHRLGLIRGSWRDAARIIVDIIDNCSTETFTMEYVLKHMDVSSHGPNLKSFYINYLQKMKESSQSENDETTTLSELKVELQNLINMRQELDSKIDVLQEKINNYKEGNVKHGRK